MKPLIFNSTPLIYLTKIGLSSILETLKEEKQTTPMVKREVVDEGKRKGVPDALILEGLFQNMVFKVSKPQNTKILTNFMETKGLHLTDAEVLALTSELNGIAVIDDEVARKVAKIYGIAYIGTPSILIKAILQRLITKERAKQAINEMISAGWRCSIETYSKIIDVIEKLQDSRAHTE